MAKTQMSEIMKQILIKVPQWVDEELVKLQIDRILALESKKRELIEETLKKLDIGDKDLRELEKIRGEVWKKEKKKLRLSSS
ncbi:MAG: hypothetical protein O8C63_05420 [Candidatus Methanoperedens sp.]|nr:hypothetical protein [Candidatus Methanoperedens sp.]